MRGFIVVNAKPVALRDAARGRLDAEADCQVAEISDPEELYALVRDRGAARALRDAARRRLQAEDARRREEERRLREERRAEVERRVAEASDRGELATLAVDESADGDVRALAADRLGGYLCSSCKSAVLPKGEASISCVCPACGAENHDWKHVNGEIVHRDYSSGSSYDVCRRCGKRDRIVIHDSW